MGELKVVLLPGSGGTGESYWHQEQAFPGVAYGVSLPGHPEGELRETVEEYAQWLHDEYIPGRGWSTEDVVVGGNSLGAGVSLAYGLMYPEVPGIISLGGGARLRVMFPSLSGIRRELAAIGTGRPVPESQARGAPAAQREGGYQPPPVPEEVQRRQAEKREKMGPYARLNDLLACDRFDAMDRIHEIKAPTLIIVGTEDTQTPVKYSEFLHSRIAGSRLVVIEGAGHGAAGERPDIVNAALRDFLAEVEAKRIAAATA